LASTTNLDLSRQKFRAYAFNNPCLLIRDYAVPKLLFKHDESQIAGVINSLSYDNRGNLRIRAEVTHPLAARCNAFSIGARILEYEIVDGDNENFHALISNAEVTEVSLTDRPANPHAVVQSRSRIAPVEPYLKTLSEHTDLAIKGIQIIQRGFQMLAEMQVNATPPRRAAPQRPPMISAPRRSTQFQQLVQQLESRA
jgi:phage head maturation protease